MNIASATLIITRRESSQAAGAATGNWPRRKAAEPRAKIDFEVKEQYRNMRLVLEKHPKVVENALEAVRRAGLEPRLHLIRGGTDGARLSFMGLPTPNIFTGGHNFHSKLEWISVQDMESAVGTIVELAKIWAESP